MTDFFQLHKKHFSLNDFVFAALSEDLGDGDHTSYAIIPATHKGKMRLLVKEDGVIAGVEAAKKLCSKFDKSLKFHQKIKDGSLVRPGDVAFILEGKTQHLLILERLLLNTMQRMSGIATHTHELMKLCKGTKAKVIDTRKTTPGFRFFEKWAVAIGGGGNHRYGLFDMILIKDNHIDFAGGIEKSIDAANAYLKSKRKKLKIEIEVRSLADLEMVLKKGQVNRVMLDNFSIADTKTAVKRINGRIECESSGGITKSNLRDYAKTGVDFISVGALTHQIKSLDLSLKAF